MIDWANAIAGGAVGLVMGLAPTGIGWRMERQKRKRDLFADWLAAAGKIEHELWKPDLNPMTVYYAQQGLPIDHWRKELGPAGFIELEDLSQALARVQFWNRRDRLKDSRRTAELEKARKAVNDARTAFVNWRRMSSSSDYNDVVKHEQRQTLIRDLLRRPVPTLRREVHNARVRRQYRRTQK